MPNIRQRLCSKIGKDWAFHAGDKLQSALRLRDT
jgi:hypothetical protein